MNRGLLVAGAMSCVLACHPGTDVPQQPASATPVAASMTNHPAVVLPDRTVIQVELATDDETREQGLMYRESLDPLKGMLFIFPSTGEYPFWMKNTMIPLDMIWIDEGSRIVHVESNVPPCTADPCPSYPPGAMAKYVLELKAGEAAAHRLKAGDAVGLRNVEGVSVR